MKKRLPWDNIYPRIEKIGYEFDDPNEARKYINEIRRYFGLEPEDESVVLKKHDKWFAHVWYTRKKEE